MLAGPATEENQFARDLFTGIPDRYDTLEELLSLGQNGRWRRAMVDRIVPAAPARVLDVASGTAGVAVQLVDRTPGFVVGIDLTPAMLARGARNIRTRGAEDRISLVNGRAERLPFADATFDGLTFTYLLRYVADPTQTLRELARVLTPGAPIASLEFCVPSNPLWHAAWWLYTRLVLPAAGALAGAGWFRVGRFLGPNISQHYRRYPVDWTLQALRDAGFVDVGVRTMSLGGGVVMWGVRSGA